MAKRSIKLRSFQNLQAHALVKKKKKKKKLALALK